MHDTMIRSEPGVVADLQCAREAVLLRASLRPDITAAIVAGVNFIRELSHA